MIQIVREAEIQPKLITRFSFGREDLTESEIGAIQELIALFEYQFVFALHQSMLRYRSKLFPAWVYSLPYMYKNMVGR